MLCIVKPLLVLHWQPAESTDILVQLYAGTTWFSVYKQRRTNCLRNTNNVECLVLLVTCNQSDIDVGKI